MALFSKNVESEILKALDENEEVMFVSNEKLISIKGEEPIKNNESESSLATEIEQNSELKASLDRYINNPVMPRYTAKELKGLRNERRM